MNDPLPPVIYDHHDDGVAVITLNRPEKKNAINLGMARLVQNCLQQAGQDDALSITRQIAHKSPLASQAVKAIVRHGLTQHETPTLDYQQGWVEQARRAATKSF